MKLVPVKQGQGYYLSITAEEAARVINSNLADYVWHDGQEAPMGSDNTESFNFVRYLTTRYNYGFNLGQKAIDQATWPILSVHAGFMAQKAMTARTLSVLSTLTTTGNWSGNTNTATILGGGRWDVSGPTDKFIRKTFNKVCENVLQSTIGVVQRTDLVCVINPHDARLMAETEEIRDYLKQSPFAMAEVRGDVESQNGEWGLPNSLWGVKIIVEDAVQITTRKAAATKTTVYCLPSGNAIFLARPGSLLGMEGIPEFSTAQLFVYEEMSVETLTDVNNRRTVGRVVDDFATALVAPASGYYVTSTTTQ
ncbi:hypothetical protein AYO40_01195 [Planctomycetaceae bacterium SCGC AG-212-D15]|nr:hypothetical protein AYO40_01195 [Planctomycetaceae bacterium SCGC AG-212-D15]